jgi:hypothetical protein
MTDQWVRSPTPQRHAWLSHAAVDTFYVESCGRSKRTPMKHERNLRTIVPIETRSSGSGLQAEVIGSGGAG